jgi:hypothetical protein
MLRKILFVSLIGLLFTVLLAFTNNHQSALASSYIVTEDDSRQVLDATVRITLFASLTDNQGNPQYVMVDGQKAIQYVVGEGLGTLTRSGADVLIVTHDHWTLLTSNLKKVQFHNVAGDLILEVSGAEFQQMIRYRDGGTMVLDAADELLSGLMAVSMGDSRSINSGDIVIIAYRQPENGRITTATMIVKQISVYQNKPVFQLTSREGQSVIGGNSGGGVTVNGQIVGNMWTTTMEHEVLRETGEAVSPLAQTSVSLAAQLPTGIVE